MLTAALVIVVHHLGYWNCRSKILIPISAGVACSVLTLAYLVTASTVAPTLGHIFLHFAATTHGVEMPPVKRPHSSPAQPGRMAPPRAA